MNDHPTRYMVLRHQRRWDQAATLTTLAHRADGALVLSDGENDGYLLIRSVDAGVEEVWERVWVEAEMTGGGQVTLAVAVSARANAVPASTDWKIMPTLDVFLPAMLSCGTARYLWLRVTLARSGNQGTPRLLQVQASTPVPSYLDHLPRIYRRDDTNGFLENWLALARSELGDWEQALDEGPRHFDTRTVSESDLGKLGEWVGIDLPSRMDAPERRKLLADTMALYKRRGTPIGLREWVRRHLGVNIHIYEAYRERRLWQLGQGDTAVLGLGTQLPAGVPDGLVASGFSWADRSLSGLRGDYYEGTKFEILRHSKLDGVIDFDWRIDSPLKNVDSQKATFPADNFSVRWNGQFRPRYSETYTLRTRSDDGVRLWVGGRLIIDNWTDHAPTEDAGQIKLEAGRWYPIVLEFYERGTLAVIKLYWSSASQRSEIIPQECLYSILDEYADFEPAAQSSGALMEVGRAVVGQSRPLSVTEFGAPLADDYAHLFTVVVPAAEVPLAADRHTLRAMIESEKPAHTDFDLCLVEPRMRVGVQARLGVDSIVAGVGAGMRLDSARLGGESHLGNDLVPQQKCAAIASPHE